MIIDYKDSHPKLGKNVFVAPDAWVIGNVTLEDPTSVFFSSVLRGDLEHIHIGKESNIQEQSVLHTTRKRSELRVGQGCTLGHRVTLHSAVVGDYCLIGMGAILLDDSAIEDECIIAAGAVVTGGKRIPSRSLVIGSPGKVVRTLRDEELAFLRQSADNYVNTAADFLKMDLG